MSKPKLQIIIASTRLNRVGPAPANWLAKVAYQHAGFEVELVDLVDFQLPVFDEPEHPRKQIYHHEHTRKWSAKVAEADAFIFVMPEYDYFPPASLVNALQYLSVEWHYKPVGFLGYSSGISAAMRSVQAIKLLVTSLKMMPMSEVIAVPYINKYLSPDGFFKPEEITEKAAYSTLNELLKWTEGLIQIRGL